MREIRQRTRVVGAFKSARVLVAARPRYVEATGWGTKRCLQMNRLAEVVGRDACNGRSGRLHCGAKTQARLLINHKPQAALRSPALLEFASYRNPVSRNYGTSRDRLGDYSSVRQLPDWATTHPELRKNGDMAKSI